MKDQKQIEEMARVIANKTALSIVEATGIAEILTGENYRKQSEGEWVISDTLYSDGEWHRHTCSLCEYKTGSYTQNVRDIGFKYCPNCGANMKDGE